MRELKDKVEWITSAYVDSRLWLHLLPADEFSPGTTVIIITTTSDVELDQLIAELKRQGFADDKWVVLFAAAPKDDD